VEDEVDEKFQCAAITHACTARPSFWMPSRIAQM